MICLRAMSSPAVSSRVWPKGKTRKLKPAFRGALVFFIHTQPFYVRTTHAFFIYIESGQHGTVTYTSYIHTAVLC